MYKLSIRQAVESSLWATPGGDKQNVWVMLESEHLVTRGKGERKTQSRQRNRGTTRMGV